MKKIFVRRVVVEIAFSQWVDSRQLNEHVRSCLHGLPNVLELQITNVKSIPTPRYQELTSDEVEPATT